MATARWERNGQQLLQTNVFAKQENLPKVGRVTPVRAAGRFTTSYDGVPGDCPPHQFWT
jgi:hypothetical protein